MEAASSYHRPNIVVFGVGHSGTSVVTKMLGILGWHLNDADTQYFETSSMTSVNVEIVSGAEIDLQAMCEVLRRFAAPYVVKDPRLVLTLDKWKAAFDLLGDLPFLVHLTRDRSKLEASYLQRGETVGGVAGTFGFTLEELLRRAHLQADEWPGPKVELGYEDLRRAVAVFGGPRRMSPEGGLWHEGTARLRLNELLERIRVAKRHRLG